MKQSRRRASLLEKLVRTIQAGSAQAQLTQTVAKTEPSLKVFNKGWHANGYGLMLLILFMSSTVLIGASMSLMLGNLSAAYLGTYSQDTQSAAEVAQSGMETVLADIQSKLNQGTTVDTSYTYNSATSGTNVTMPNDPANLGGSTTTIGSYTATMTAARGNSYLLNVVATVNNSNYSYSKLLSMGRSTNALIDTLSGGNANAIYSMRKLRSAYSGPAIRIRRSSDNTEQDIGFDSNGDLDLVSLKSFLSMDTFPIDSVSGVTVAYGLRRLTNSYTGAAINVRRSSDNTAQDIGFTSAGDLDVAALMNFVGNNTGYVTKWYDQSGNGYNATQGTTGNQPTIVTSGVLNLVNNRPSITFDGSNDTLQLSQAVYDDITILAVYNAISCPGTPGSSPASECRIINSDQTGIANDFMVGVDNTGGANAFVGNPDTISGAYATGIAAPGDGRLHWLTFLRQKSSSYYRVFNDSSLYWDGNGNTNSLNALNKIYLSWNANLGLSEVLMYPIAMGLNRLVLQRNQAWYFNLYPYWANWTLPLDISGMPSASAAYGLRRLRSGYSGKLIRVRRSSDNTTQDIGFDSAMTGNLDVKSLLSFVGTGSGYVTTWYDQSGNGKHMTQVTAGKQPMIVNAGTLVTESNLPTLQFTPANSTYLTSAAIFPSGQAKYTYAAVARTNNSSSTQTLFDQSLSFQSTNRRAALAIIGGGTFYRFIGESNDTGGLTTANPNVLNSIIMTQDSTLATNVNMYLNAGYDTSGASTHPSLLNMGNSGASIGACYWGSNELWNGLISEVIVFPSVLSSANIQALGQNQESYFSNPTPTAYVAKWYDQSGNGHDLANSNPLSQPQLLMHPYAANSGRPTVLFNGAQYLYSTTGMPTNADYSKVAVFSYFGTGANNATYGTNSIISSDAVNMHAFYLAGTANIRLSHTGDFATASSASGFNMSPNINYSSTGTYVQSSKTGTVYVFNQSAGTGTTSTSNTDAGFQLGAHQGAQYPMFGTISEAMIFARNLNATDRSAIYYDERGYFGAQ